MASTRKNASKRSRDLEGTRKEILNTAFSEIFARGFQGVSMDDLVKKTRYTKGAFYHQFPSKMDLGYALVEEVITPMILERWVDPLEDYTNPLEGILEQMQKLIGDASASHLKLGCPLNNLVQEMSTVDAGFKRRLQKALQIWIKGIQKHLIRAQQNGQLSKKVNTEDLAKFVVMSHEGFYGFIKGTDDTKAFKTLFTSLKTYFSTLQAA